MTLEELGYSSDVETSRREKNLDSFSVGRITSEHRERYVVRTDSGEFEAEITGNLRYSAENQSEYPAVGDWVALSEYDENKMLIHAVLPRKNSIERQAIGKFGEKQIIAANIDYALIVQAVDRDFNLNRMERYLTICNTSKISPLLVMSKIDLITDPQLKDLSTKIAERNITAPLVTISNYTYEGVQELSQIIKKGKTYCLLGSSGVGKSTLINNLLGSGIMKTGETSPSTNKGRHVTSHRELIILDNGGILIDNPGMREVGIADASNGLEDTFDIIYRLSGKCKFKDCTHIQESGCAILEAVESGEIDRDSYENYMKLEREKTFYESSVVDKRKKDKDFGKMIKNFKKDKKHLDGSI